MATAAPSERVRHGDGVCKHAMRRFVESRDQQCYTQAGAGWLPLRLQPLPDQDNRTDCCVDGRNRNADEANHRQRCKDRVARADAVAG